MRPKPGKNRRRRPEKKPFFTIIRSFYTQLFFIGGQKSICAMIETEAITHIAAAAAASISRIISRPI